MGFRGGWVGDEEKVTVLGGIVARVCVFFLLALLPKET